MLAEPAKGKMGPGGGQELAGDEIELGYNSIGLADEDLLDGKVIHYTGNSADILEGEKLEQLSDFKG